MAARVPENDERERAVCLSCGHVHYANPKVVCGCVVASRTGSVLMARRAIEPRAGYWGFPQGYMENGETTRECAAREVLEETGAVVDPDTMRLLALYNLPNQVQILYKATVSDDALADLPQTTKESSDVKLFTYDALPLDALAFPTVAWALDFAHDHDDVFANCDGTFGSSTATRVQVQQRTKVYDPILGEWLERQDLR